MAKLKVKTFFQFEIEVDPAGHPRYLATMGASASLEAAVRCLVLGVKGPVGSFVDTVPNRRFVLSLPGVLDEVVAAAAPKARQAATKPSKSKRADSV